MKVRWPGLILVLLLVAVVLALKHYKRPRTEGRKGLKYPAVLMIADLNEAGETNDVCAEIIRATRDVGQQGVPVEELMPNAEPELLKRYRVLSVPTVLILHRDGKEVARFEGEDKSTLRALRARLGLWLVWKA